LHFVAGIWVCTPSGSCYSCDAYAEAHHIEGVYFAPGVIALVFGVFVVAIVYAVIETALVVEMEPVAVTAAAIVGIADGAVVVAFAYALVLVAVAFAIAPAVGQVFGLVVERGVVKCGEDGDFWLCYYYCFAMLGFVVVCIVH
jgi:hypothetical protein